MTCTSAFSNNYLPRNPYSALAHIEKRKKRAEQAEQRKRHNMFGK